MSAPKILKSITTKENQTINKKIIQLIIILIMMLLYTPVYATAAKATIQIPVHCKTDGNEETCEIVLCNEKKQDIQTLCLQNEEDGNFELQYNTPGTYKYEIYQKGKDNQTRYCVEVYVTEDESLKAEAILFKKGSTEKTSSCNFVNHQSLKSQNHTSEQVNQVTQVNNVKSVKTGVETHTVFYFMIFLFGLLIGVKIIFQRIQN